MRMELTEASALLSVSPGVCGGGGATGLPPAPPLPPAAPYSGLEVGTAAPAGVDACGAALTTEPAPLPPPPLVPPPPLKLDIGGSPAARRGDSCCCCGDMVP